RIFTKKEDYVNKASSRMYSLSADPPCPARVPPKNLPCRRPRAAATVRISTAGGVLIRGTCRSCLVRTAHQRICADAKTDLLMFSKVVEDPRSQPVCSKRSRCGPLVIRSRGHSRDGCSRFGAD